MTNSNTNNQPSVQFHKINENNVNQRVDNFLITTLKGVPKTHIYRILRKGEVRVNKKRIKPDYHLKLNDQIRIPPIRLSSKVKHTPSVSAIKLLEQRIIYEDEKLIVINKPSGMASHGGSGINFGVIETLRNMRPKTKFLELAHRLDRDTSGCIVIAKKRSVLLELQDLLHKHQIGKTYLALVHGTWKGKIRIVDAPLQKNQLKSGERVVYVNNAGKAAKTEFELRQQLGNTALLKVTIYSGRTHQIRVHAAHIGYPIVGDEKYGSKELNKNIRNIGLKRLFLHAYNLKFKLPSASKEIDIKSELDKDLLEVLKKIS